VAHRLRAVTAIGRLLGCFPPIRLKWDEAVGYLGRRKDVGGLNLVGSSK
jgi:hypothetical protein